MSWKSIKENVVNLFIIIVVGILCFVIIDGILANHRNGGNHIITTDSVLVVDSISGLQ